MVRLYDDDDDTDDGSSIGDRRLSLLFFRQGSIITAKKGKFSFSYNPLRILQAYPGKKKEKST